MESGTNINPVTLRPKQAARGDGAKNRAEQKKRLEEQAKDLALVYSDEAERFKELVMGRMEKRITALVMEDPEATAYHDLLRELGHKVNMAKRATERLYREHVGIEDEAKR